MIVLSSLQNPRVKSLVRLRNRRDRDHEQKVLVEGYRALRRALSNGYPIDELYYCESLFQGENEGELISGLIAGGARAFATTVPVFRKIAYRDRPEGLLGVGRQFHLELSDLDVGCTSPLLLVAESIEKPGNLGTMLRSADAAGVSGLVVCDACTDLFNPNVVRASTGNLFTVPVAEATSEEAVSWLRDRGIAILAASPHAECLLWDVDLTGPVAIVVGAEQYGLSPRWMSAADIQVRLPMLGVADSLNVSTATALLLFEAVRQRMGAGLTADPGAKLEDDSEHV